jgi:hypothetical protein
MIGILDHKWGVSAAQDRVWAQVSGISPRLSGRRLFMVLQAFMDDSYTENGVFVLGGYIASAQAWADFAAAWEDLLPLFALRGKSGRYRFKMTEMARRMECVPPFYKVIERHALLSLSCKFVIADLVRATDRVWAENVNLDWGFANRPHSFAFKCLLDMFHMARFLNPQQYIIKTVVSPDQKVDFYFDDQSQKREMLGGWDLYIRNQPTEIKDLYGATPRFENDEDFLPLQAADFWAWWVRKSYQEGTLEKIQAGDFGGWVGTRRIPDMAISFNEEQLVSALMTILRSHLGEEWPIYDGRVTPRRQ